ncbi:hypothetical protein ACIRQP_18885 [Streptomyces sp. NPDC102274]|uniref:hypothetical protein n=1 Tax=Streptomyces sp. NPDC102274 TaxID=3366151 RepID=UPI0037F62A62
MTAGAVSHRQATPWASLTGAQGETMPYRSRLCQKEATVRERLAGREIGSQLTAHIERSLRKARRLDAEAPVGTVLIPTDGRSVQDIAIHVLQAAAW